jgi:hypothetical protein
MTECHIFKKWFSLILMVMRLLETSNYIIIYELEIPQIADLYIFLHI